MRVNVKPGHFRACRGRADQPHIKYKHFKPWINAVRWRVNQLLRWRDRSTELLQHETSTFFEYLPERSQLEAKHRSTALSPKDRAQVILFEIFRQKNYTPLEVVIRCCASEICLRRSGLRPPTVMKYYDNVQRAKVVFRMLRPSKKTYTHDSGNGEVREITVSKKMSLQSYHVAGQLVEQLRPLYAEWMREEEATITGRVLRMASQVARKKQLKVTNA